MHGFLIPEAVHIKNQKTDPFKAVKFMCKNKRRQNIVSAPWKAGFR